jgi:hypothetical protein
LIEQSSFRPPTEVEIAAAQKRLGVLFHPDYLAFISGGYDVGSSTLKPALIVPGIPHLDLFKIAQVAWEKWGVPRHMLPFIHDNADYYCLTPDGEVVYWSHDGPTDEKWPSIEAWRRQVCGEGR